ncbi:hypothetical protein [Sinomonas flava]|uniref:hypothetical protein n=1 Tax=Sinomonas TaxID=596707 RepID=UPI0039A62F50
MEQHDRHIYRRMIENAASGLAIDSELRLSVHRLGGWTENGWWEAAICRPEDTESLMRGDMVTGTHLTFEDRTELMAWLAAIGAVPADAIPVRWEALAGFTCAVALSQGTHDE